MKKLHLVAFNVPYPADYGGVIDIYNKIKAFNKIGVKVILHCFEYGRAKSIVLDELCEEVIYYPRNKGPFFLLDSLPYIVSTRSSKNLAENLRKNDLPVLFEGLHTTASLNQLSVNDRRLVVRTHNVEHDYYKGLSEAEGNLSRKLYYYSESVKLKQYEKILNRASGVAAISNSDYEYFSHTYSNVQYIPAFHPYNDVDILSGRGEYALFHGNLSVPENQKAVLYLIDRVFRNMNYPFVIAGKNPGYEIIKAAEVNNHIKVVSNPDENDMDKLIRYAHVNILVTFQSTGIKLKLLSSLFRGRHCLVNPLMVENTGLSDLCYIAETDVEFIQALNMLFNKDFQKETMLERKRILETELSNVKNAEKLASMLF